MPTRNDWRDECRQDMPDHVRRRLQRQPSRRFAGLALAFVLAALMVLGVLAAGAALLRRSGEPAPAPPLARQPAAPEARPAAPEPRSAAPAAAAPQPLANCLPDGSRTLDNAVARCRFGQAAPPPPARDAAPPQGLVSAAYLARFRAERDAPRPAAAHAATQRSSTWLRRDDGKLYLAEWQVRDNRIDYASVCANQRRGSIEDRECRRAAKRWYRHECQTWRERRERDGQPLSRQMQERYCSAANGFSPVR